MRWADEGSGCRDIAACGCLMTSVKNKNDSNVDNNTPDVYACTHVSLSVLPSSLEHKHHASTGEA